MKSYSEDVIISLLSIMAECDGGCFICIGNMFERIRKELPELVPLAHLIFLKEVGYDYLANDWARKKRKGKEDCHET